MNNQTSYDFRENKYLPDSFILPQDDLRGHIWGMPSGIKAVKEELLFIINFHKYLYENGGKQINNNAQNTEDNQFVKFIKECVSMNYNPTDYLISKFDESIVTPYKYNNNILLNFAKTNNI